MAFPTSPSNGQIHNQYVYNATTQAWMKMDPEKAYPIGYIYTQYPEKDSPSEMGWYGTWTNKSSDFAGDFFRAEGGAASAFESGKQTDQMQGHWHEVTARTPNAAGGAEAHVGFSTNSTATIITSTRGGPISDGTNGTPRTGSETRPINRTVRIWERTA